MVLFDRVELKEVCWGSCLKSNKFIVGSLDNPVAFTFVLHTAGNDIVSMGCFELPVTCEFRV